MKTAERGVAIVLALGTVALAAIVAVGIMATQSTWARHGELTAGHGQAQALVQAGADWARSLLSDDRRIGNVDHLGEPWALRLPPVPVESGEIAGYIEDQGGAFNLNNVVIDGKVSLAQLARLRRLLSILELPPALADALADWLDADDVPQPQGGAEDRYYSGLHPPYLTANRPLTDVAELALVRGFDPAVRARLRSFVTALPRSTAVNVNTATPEVLTAVVEGLTLDDARALAARRDRAYFRDRADFMSRLPSGATAAAADISVSSDFFLVTLRAAIGDAEARGSALLERQDTTWPAIIWRKHQ